MTQSLIYKKDETLTMRVNKVAQSKLTQSYACCRVVIKHFGDQLEQLQVIGTLRHDVTVKLFRVVTDVAASRRGLVPIQFSVIEIFRLGFSAKISCAISRLEFFITLFSSYLAIRVGIGPNMRSIMARCSRLSCVWKSVNPR